MSKNRETGVEDPEIVGLIQYLAIHRPNNQSIVFSEFDYILEGLCFSVKMIILSFPQLYQMPQE